MSWDVTDAPDYLIRNSAGRAFAHNEKMSSIFRTPSIEYQILALLTGPTEAFLFGF